MNSITFTITDKEIEKLSTKKVSKLRIKKILQTVENDLVLWSDIEKSIKDAIAMEL